MDVDFSNSRSIEKIFTDVVRVSHDRTNKIKILHYEVLETLGADLTECERQKLQKLLGEVEEAFVFLEQQAEYPELVLATTGTTSSRKSTLANFLIGEAILPAAVQERSAGLVRLKHSHKRRLTITPTKGATWKTGRWEGLTADEVNQRLEATMNAFRQEEESNKEVEPVVFEIEWPIRLAEKKKELGLPEGTQVTILDLPGLKTLEDERNGPIIRKNIAKAFCLIAYNAEETNPVKQKTLLNQVVGQVLALSYGEREKEEEKNKNAEKQKETHRKGSVSSLSRMLFLLNRVDVFRRDKDPVASLKKFRTAITAQIQEKLKEALPEYGEIIKGIKLAQISSLPALWAVEADRLWERPEDQAKVLKEIEKKFQYIFPDDYFEEFPRNYKDLTEEQRRSFISEALKYSYGNVFETHLSEHIAKNLPQIVVGGPLNLYTQKEKNYLDSLSFIITAYTKRTEKEAKERKALLTKAEKSLRGIVDKTKNLFFPINELFKKENFNLADAEAKIYFKDIDQRIGVENLFLSLYSVAQNTINEPFECLVWFVNELMIGGSSNWRSYWIRVDWRPYLEYLESKSLKELVGAVTTLRKTRYKDVYFKGGTIQSEKGKEVIEAREALQEFIEVFFHVWEDGVHTALKTTSQRVGEDFSRCTDVVLKQMQADCRKIGDLKEFEPLSRVFDLTLTFKRLDELQIKGRYKFPRIEKVEKSKTHSWIEDRFEVPSLEDIMKAIKFEAPSLKSIMIVIRHDKGFQQVEEKIVKFFREELFGHFLTELDKALNNGISYIEAYIGKVNAETERRNHLLNSYRKRIADFLEEMSLEKIFADVVQ